MRSLIVVCLSPAIDRNYKVTSFLPGGLNRCENPVISAGGKGVNVARVLATLGTQVRCIGFFAGNNGQYIIEDLQQNKVLVDAILLKGETRSSINILDSSTGRETEILEAGPTVYQEEMEHFICRFRQILAQEASPPLVIFSGGVPKGLPISIYEDLIKISKEYEAQCFLDSSSEALSYGINAKPCLIKPNARELSSIIKKNIETNGNIDKKFLIDIYNETRKIEIPYVAVTFGEAGSMLCVDGKVFFAHPISIMAVNTIGSGDSFTAGLAFAMANQYSWKCMLELAVACASSNALFEQVGVINLHQVKDFQNMVEIDEFVVEMR